jgi:hypothetical protein
MGIVNQSWTLKDKLIVMEMAEKGYTAKEIAHAVKRTRNSVLGFCNRNEIKFNHKVRGGKTTSARKPKPKPERKVVVKVKPVYQPKTQVYIPENGEYTSFHQLQMNNCRAVIGDAMGENTLYCGKLVMKAGCAWCEEHYKLYYARKGITTNEHKQKYTRNDKFFAKYKL